MALSGFDIHFVNYASLPMLVKVLHIFLFITMLISLAIFVLAMGMNSREHRPFYFAWQFPMLLAIFLESYYMNPK